MGHFAINEKNLADLFFQRVHHSKMEKALQQKEHGSWLDISWQEYGQEVERIAKGILPWTEPQDCIGLLSENRKEWVYADMAILSVGCASVPIYPTTVLQDIATILNEVKAKILFVSTIEQLQKILTLRREEKLFFLEKIVCFELSIHCDGVHIFSLEQCKKHKDKVGDKEFQERKGQIKPSSVSTILYTSGTTGEPKGAVLTHKNLMANLLGLQRFLSEANIRKAKMLSFLPLSHSFERMMGHLLPIQMGFQVAFSEGLENLLQNLQEIKPTLFVCVPSFYEQVYNYVLNEAKKSKIKSSLLNWCLEMGKTKAKYIASNREPGFTFQAQYEIADRILFRRVRDSFGGKLQWAISGGAPLSKKITEFLLGAGISIVEGYGLSETGPVLTANPPWAIRPNSVGKPLFNVQLKIVPEDGYDRKGEGEILAKGDNVMLAYHQKPEETKQVFTEDGWLRTGDIGYFDQDGYLYISDRKKELIKTIHGKYVAPQPIENNLKAHPLVDQAVVIGEGRAFCVLLIVPNLTILRTLLEQPQLQRHEIFSYPKVKELLQEAIDSGNASLSRWEQIRDFAILPRPLSQERGELTPTLKVKRRVVDSHFKEIIEAMYLSYEQKSLQTIFERRNQEEKAR